MHLNTITKSDSGFVNFKVLDGKPVLDDLWFMVGSRCNLSCKHCYVDSSPTNDTLEQIGIEDIRPYLLEGKKFGVSNIYFTGGEPFINKDIIKMIYESLKIADVTILTNATFPIAQYVDDLKRLNEITKKELKFRVSVDHYDKDLHDEIRGLGMFNVTMKNIKKLSSAGFIPIITTTAYVYENNKKTTDEINNNFKELFSDLGINISLKILPYNLEQGANLKRIKKSSDKVNITTNCMTQVKESDFQCHNGRTLQKIDGKMKIYPCPIIYNDKKHEMGTNLKKSFDKVYLTHKSCYDFCYRSGGSCTN